MIDPSKILFQTADEDGQSDFKRPAAGKVPDKKKLPAFRQAAC
jgi:hypothetical protein